MIRGDPNVQLVELVAAALGDLREELVLVGGCAASLLVEAPTAMPPRATWDVDLIATVTALKEYHALEARFAARGFARDVSRDAPVCRWTLGAVKVDLMPTDESVLGFSNRWYAWAAASATRVELPGGARINLISAPAFIATKLEAFRTRGRGDLLVSHDFEDIINVVEGRPTIVDEVESARPDLREYLVGAVSAIVKGSDLADTLPGLVAQDELHGQRVAIVWERLAAIAAMLPAPDRA